MCPINIPSFPAELHDAAKMMAAGEGMTLADYVARAVRESLGKDRRPESERQGDVDHGTQPGAGNGSGGGTDVAAVSVVAGPCPQCGQPTKEWGQAMRRCDRCGRNFARIPNAS